MPSYDVEDFTRDWDVSRETCDRLALFVELLERWNRRVNLVSKQSLSDLWRRHLADSAQLRDMIPPYDGALVDVGSGAGFPGLVLAIIGLRNVHLVESNAKKCAFLREAVRITGCAAVVHNVRLGGNGNAPAGLLKAGIVTARAVSPLVKLLDIVYPIVYDRTYCIFPKGAQAENELKAAREKWHFAVERVASKSDPNGVIFGLHRICRRQDNEAED